MHWLRPLTRYAAARCGHKIWGDVEEMWKRRGRDVALNKTWRDVAGEAWMVCVNCVFVVPVSVMRVVLRLARATMCAGLAELYRKDSCSLLLSTLFRGASTTKAYKYVQSSCRERGEI